MADDIVTSQSPSSTSHFNPPSRIICHVCQKQFSQYTCPRCNSRYCSLHCYKSHSIRCTESFMRDNVVEELQHLEPKDETKQKMLDILRRFHSEEETDDMDEDEDSTLSEEIIQKVLSGGQVNFDDLSVEQKRRFQRAVASGELSKMIEPWDPWWMRPSAKRVSLSKEGTQLVQPLSDQEASMLTQSENVSEVPPGPEAPLPPVSKLSSTEPSPLLAFHLVDILYSYCFTLRLYNGDWKSDAAGSATVVLGISSVLGQGGQPESVLDALSYCLEQTCSPAYRHMGGLQFGLVLVDDVANILALGSPAILCLLSDLLRLVQTGYKDVKQEPSRQRSREIITILKLATKKIYFIMCWVHEQPSEAWSSLASIIRAEKSLGMDFERISRSGKTSKEAKKGKVLIEEMK